MAKKRSLNEAENKPFHTPFASLLSQQASPSVASTPSNEQETGVESEEQAIDLVRCGKIVVRKEKKGRKGKTVTLISGLEGANVELARIAQELRRAFGCGSTVEEEQILLQGDLRERARSWLLEHGAKQVVLAN